MHIISRFSNLKELSLEDNNVSELPEDLSEIMPALENLNLNGNNFDEENVSNEFLNS
jgi:Leucine-rich repeat (LRR) protein